MDLVSAIKGDDLRERNKALKSLYMNPVVNAKVNEWAAATNLKGWEPDDILQESLIILDRNIREGKFKGESKTQTYLLGICRRVLYSKFRKNDKLVFGDFLSMLGDATPLDHPFESEERLKSEAAINGILEEAIGGLKEDCRKGIRLYHYKRIPMAEIASILNLKNATQARKKISNCRKKLRQLIESHPRFEVLFE